MIVFFLLRNHLILQLHYLTFCLLQLLLCLLQLLLCLFQLYFKLLFAAVGVADCRKENSYDDEISKRITADRVKYDVVTDYGKLMDLVGRAA